MGRLYGKLLSRADLPDASEEGREEELSGGHVGALKPGSFVDVILSQP